MVHNLHRVWRVEISIPKEIYMAKDAHNKAAEHHENAAIGPGIGKCCYQVGAEVAAHFGGQGSGHIDLADANRRQLEEAGVTGRRIYASNLCTMCRAEEFYSFRRDQDAAGRMFSFAGIREPAPGETPRRAVH